MDDLRAWLAIPSTGTAETAAAPFWRTLMNLRPDARVVVVRRPVDQVVESLTRLGHWADRGRLEADIRRLDAKLNQIVKRVPGVLVVSYESLASEEGCKRVFEFCLPFKHDPDWWRYWAKINVQIDMRHLVQYYNANKPQISKLAEQVRCLTLADLDQRRLREPDDLVFSTESFEAMYRDIDKLASQHCVAVGERPGNYADKNIDLLNRLDRLGSLQTVTARCNGRLFGYLVTVIGPSLEDPGVTTAEHTTFFASPEFAGLGRQLQKFAKQALVERGVHELLLRAGTRGDGPRLAALYRRMGAEDHGQLFKLNLTT